jgi:plasmid stabilization system protein ParE
VSAEVRFSADAVAELEAAAAWYEERLPGLGDAFVMAVDAALSRVADWPRSGSSIPAAGDLDLRRVPVARFPYNLPFLLLDDGVRVLAVAHDRRRPGYWMARVDE